MKPSITQTYALAIHTASPDLGLALSNFSGDARSQVWELGRELSTQMHSGLLSFLTPQTWSDLQFLAVAKGPGGFTGTRMGVVAARTLAQQLEIPLFSISTLAAIAWSQRPMPAADAPDLAVQLLAQRGEIHTAIYSAELRSLRAEAVMAPSDWQQTLETWPRPHRLITAADRLGETAVALLELAHRDWQQGDRPHWSEALPFYGQSPV